MLLFAEKGGHGMIFNTFDVKAMLVMHCPNEHSNERTVISEFLLG